MFALIKTFLRQQQPVKPALLDLSPARTSRTSKLVSEQWLILYRKTST